MAFPYDRSNNPRAAITWGKSYNFFKKQSIAAAAFASDCDLTIPFSTQTVTFQLESTGKIEYSFNGTDVHGDMENGKSSASLIFENRPVCKVWFRLVSGTGTLRVEAWGTR